MGMTLNGATAIVTGGATGIGYGIAVALARAGVIVAIADLDLSKAEVAASAIKSEGGEAIAIQLDVTQKVSVYSCIEQAIGSLSHVDILVNNAGVFQRRLGFELDDEDFNRCIDVNLTGIWRMTQALVPHLKSRGRGKIINISSTGGRRGIDFASAYCAAKAGVISLTQSLASALGGDGINVNAVCPGAVSTAMREEIRTLGAKVTADSAGGGPSYALRGPLTAEDIGHAVVFFASDQARNITGQALNVDCGFLMN
jgi:NAD(P)-dependent dehydrogenase (short-subunit alcohol dehydrogenase family)